MMTNTFSRLAPMPVRRWLPVLLLVSALHLAAIYWVLSPTGKPVSRAHAQAMVTAELQLAPALQPDVPEPVAAVPTPKPAPVVRHAEPVAHETRSGNDGGDELSDAPAETNPVGIEVPGTSVEEALPVTTPVPVSGKTAGKADGSAAPLVLGTPVRYQVSAPPSADLRYDVHALSKGQDIYGKGRIQWQSDGAHFNIQGEFSILFLSILNFHSEGVIDPEFGVSPRVYTEKRFHHDETDTHFRQDRHLIDFSASKLAYRRQGGEQDRASVIWQLAGIGRRDGGKFHEGAEFNLVVAGVRDAEIRHIRVLALEDVETGVGRVKAWHLVHNRLPGSYQQTMDIWLSPEKNWYPVKLRYMEKNGDYLDMMLSDIRPAAAP